MTSSFSLVFSLVFIRLDRIDDSFVLFGNYCFMFPQLKVGFLFYFMSMAGIFINPSLSNNQIHDYKIKFCVTKLMSFALSKDLWAIANNEVNSIEISKPLIVVNGNRPRDKITMDEIFKRNNKTVN